MKLYFYLFWQQLQYYKRATHSIFANSTSTKLLFTYLIFASHQILIFPFKVDYNNDILDITSLFGFYLSLLLQVILMIIFLYTLSVLSHDKKAFTYSKNNFYILLISLFVNTMFYTRNESKLFFSINISINCLLIILFIISICKEINFTDFSKSQNFKNIQKHCGFINLIYTPNFKTMTGIDSYYILSINPNIKTWWSIGLLMLSTKNGVYSKGKFVRYAHIDSMNQQLNKKFKAYTNDELLLLKMYSF
jgi:hypothetical protein